MTQNDLERIKNIDERIDMLQFLINDLQNEKNKIILADYKNKVSENEALKILKGEKL